MTDQVTPQPHHWSVQWIYSRWPKWAKIASIAVAIAGGVGTIMGLGGQLVNAVHSRDTALQAEAIAKKLDQDRDAKVDATLAEHGKAIQETRAGVQDIQNHLSKQDVDLLGTKDTLNRIETAILTNASAPRVSLPPLPTPSPP